MTDKIVDRINKLLELSKSPNQHEELLRSGDLVMCEICKSVRVVIDKLHLNTHSVSVTWYRETYPKSNRYSKTYLSLLKQVKERSDRTKIKLLASSRSYGDLSNLEAYQYRGNKFSESSRLNLSRLRKGVPKSKEHISKIMNSIRLTKNNKLTKHEKLMQSHLNSLGFISNEIFKPLNYYLKSYKPDFINYDKKIIIELDSEMHNKPDRVIRDQRRDQWFSSLGYRTLRIKNYEIDLNIEDVLIKINKFINTTD